MLQKGKREKTESIGFGVLFCFVLFSIFGLIRALVFIVCFDFFVSRNIINYN